jgi:hypothetical protein
MPYKMQQRSSETEATRPTEKTLKMELLHKNITASILQSFLM